MPESADLETKKKKKHFQPKALINKSVYSKQYLTLDRSTSIASL